MQEKILSNIKIMFGALKNRTILILSVLSVLFFLGAVSSCNNARSQKASRDEEKVARLQLEEKMSKFSQEKSVLEEKAKAKEKESQELKDTLDSTKKSLVQEQLVNQSMREELEKVSKLKESLEEDLKNAQAEARKAKMK